MPAHAILQQECFYLGPVRLAKLRAHLGFSQLGQRNRNSIRFHNGPRAPRLLHLRCPAKIQ